MKKTIYLLASVILFLSCKKESSNPITNNTNVSKTKTDSVNCIENNEINFASKGNSVGTFGPCIQDIDGNVYKTVIIGNQRWMAENLKVSKYNDGTTINKVYDSIEWTKLKTSAWTHYNNDIINDSKFGKFYNGYVVISTDNGNKNVCPTSWHVPSDSEWTTLTDYLDGVDNAGSKLIEINNTNWQNNLFSGSNLSLFTALPGGEREYDGTYDAKGYVGYWWSSSHQNSNVLCRLIEDSKIFSSSKNKNRGYSIRCIKD